MHNLINTYRVIQELLSFYSFFNAKTHDHNLLGKRQFRSKAVVMLLLFLLIPCLMFLPLVCWGSVFGHCCLCITYVLSSFAIILTSKLGRWFPKCNCLPDCKCSIDFPHSTVGWSAVCYYGIS